MKVLTVILLLMAAAPFGCGKRDDLEHRVRNYEVVEEGSASGVTTSLGGEQAGTVPALTATNVDTTTDLTLIPGTTTDTTTTATAPGSLAETLQIEPGAPPSRGTPPSGFGRQPSTAPRTARTVPAPSQGTTPERPSRSVPARDLPPAEPQPAPPVEEPPAEEPPAEEPPPTSTTPTTTSTQPEAPPPPTTTSTASPPA